MPEFFSVACRAHFMRSARLGKFLAADVFERMLFLLSSGLPASVGEQAHQEIDFALGPLLPVSSEKA